MILRNHNLRIYCFKHAQILQCSKSRIDWLFTSWLWGLLILAHNELKVRRIFMFSLRSLAGMQLLRLVGLGRSPTLFAWVLALWFTGLCLVSWRNSRRLSWLLLGLMGSLLLPLWLAAIDSLRCVCFLGPHWRSTKQPPASWCVVYNIFFVCILRFGSWSLRSQNCAGE